MTKHLAIAIALVFFAAGCGGGDSSSPKAGDDAAAGVAEKGDTDVGLNDKEQALADAIAAQTAGGGELVLPAADATCWGEALVGELGVDGLAAIGLTADSADAAMVDVDAATGLVLVDSLDGCTDLKQLFKNTLTGEFEGALQESTADCILDTVSDADLKELIGLGFAADAPSGSTEVESRFSQAIVTCAPA